MTGHQWIDINEYSRNFGLSVSTIRRRIRSGRLEIQRKNGKYLIKVKSVQLAERAPLVLENKKLHKKVQLLEQEIQELKMLINIYERKKLTIVGKGLPAIPLSN